MKMYRVNGYKRISKKNAERRYNDGETIYLCPHQLRPGKPWYPEVGIVKGDKVDDCQYFVVASDDFEKVVSEFTYYNCNYEVGHYPAYYIKEVDKDD